MDNGKCGQMGIMVNTEDRDGAPLGMGHMGDGQWAKWSMWSCARSCATSLVLDILTSFNLNQLSPSQGYFIF